jgi:hypothetical protein
LSPRKKVVKVIMNFIQLKKIIVSLFLHIVADVKGRSVPIYGEKGTSVLGDGRHGEIGPKR